MLPSKTFRCFLLPKTPFLRRKCRLCRRSPCRWRTSRPPWPGYPQDQSVSSSGRRSARATWTRSSNRSSPRSESRRTSSRTSSGRSSRWPDKWPCFDPRPRPTKAAPATRRCIRNARRGRSTLGLWLDPRRRFWPWPVRFSSPCGWPSWAPPNRPRNPPTASWGARGWRNRRPAEFPPAILWDFFWWPNWRFWVTWTRPRCGTRWWPKWRATPTASPRPCIAKAGRLLESGKGRFSPTRRGWTGWWRKTLVCRLPERKRKRLSRREDAESRRFPHRDPPVNKALICPWSKFCRRFLRRYLMKILFKHFWYKNKKPNEPSTFRREFFDVDFSSSFLCLLCECPPLMLFALITSLLLPPSFDCLLFSSKLFETV